MKLTKISLIIVNLCFAVIGACITVPRIKVADWVPLPDPGDPYDFCVANTL